MNNTAKVEKILSQIRNLDKESRYYLMQRLSKHSRAGKKEISQISHQLTELNSLGSEIWQDLIIDDYIQKERQWD